MMRVRCVTAPERPDGSADDAGIWIAVGRDYVVVSILAQPDGRTGLQIIADDGSSLAWFDSVLFRVVDGDLPRNWRSGIRADGVVSLAPASWQAPGFWESYYDGDSAASAVVERELRLITEPNGRE